MRFRRVPDPATPEQPDDRPRAMAWDGIPSTPGPAVVIHAVRAGELSQQTAA
jgi:hypothetical protein